MASTSSILMFQLVELDLILTLLLLTKQILRKQSKLKVHQQIYHSALRFITSNNYNAHHCELYAKVGSLSLSLSARRDKNWVLFIYKALTGFLRPSIISLLSFNAGPYTVHLQPGITCRTFLSLSHFYPNRAI